MQAERHSPLDFGGKQRDGFPEAKQIPSRGILILCIRDRERIWNSSEIPNDPSSNVDIINISNDDLPCPAR